MRKIFCRLALITGVLILLCGVAGADNAYYFRVNSVTPSSRTIFEASAGKTISIDFTVRIGVLVSSDDAVSIDGYYKSADVLSWTVRSEDLFKQTSTKITIGGQSYSAPNCIRIGLANGTPAGIIDANVIVYGTMVATTETLIVDAVMNSSDAENLEANSELAQRGDVKSGTISLTTDSAPTSKDLGNVDSPYWNGLDPTFGKRGGSDKSKPKLRYKTVEAFTAGEIADREVYILGSQPLIDVYIAGKDAVKLFNLDKDQRKVNIRLTKENIKKYHIPFRVTSYDITSADGKYASSTVTITFNGANVAYKNYPLTFAMENNATKKPIAQVLKINVTPNTASPIWTTEADTTTVIDSSGSSLYSEQKTIPAASSDILKADQENYTVTNIENTYISGDVISTDSDGNYAVKSPDATADDSYVVVYISDDVLSADSLDAGFEFVYVTGNVKAISYYVDYTTMAYSEITSKKALEVPVAVQSTNGTFDPVIYKVSGDGGPYIITGKPEVVKVKNGVKLTKKMNVHTIGVLVKHKKYGSTEGTF